MKKKKVMGIIIISSIIVGTVISLLFILYPKTPTNNSNGEKTHSYLYPNFLFANGTYTDLVVENDDKIHFVIASWNSSCTGAVYGKLDLCNSSFEYFPIIGNRFINIIEVNIALNTKNKPITYIYIYMYNSFFELVSIIKQLRGTRAWDTYEPLIDLPYNLSIYTMGPLLNWHFKDEGNLSMAYLYSYGDEWAIPVIYREKDQSWTFLNNTFPEVKSRTTYAPGDFKEKDGNTFLLWDHYISNHSSYPILVVYWKTEGWKLYELGNQEDRLIPLSLFPKEEYCDIFSYNPGLFTNRGQILQTRIYNSSYLQTSVIKEFDQKIQFYGGSMESYGNNSYVFSYTKKNLTASDDYDLYLGCYNGDTYTEYRLTSTPDLDEYVCSLEIGEKYIHYCWMTTPWKEQETVDRTKTKIYYNRTLLSSLFEGEQILPEPCSNVSTQNEFSGGKPQHNFIFRSQITRLNPLTDELICFTYLNHYSKKRSK
ncbi:MAG: hypothetical protein ACTSQE_12695 [Candidatus Heimdallarchaeaceae archaeon]